MRYVALVQANRVEEADQFAEAFISNHPDALDLEERHARLLVARGEIKPALAHFERILHRDANNSDVLLAVALIRMQLEEWKAARRALLHHLKLNPQSDETRMHLGRVAMARERYDEAIEWYSKVRDETLLFAAQLRIASALQETEGNEAALEHLYGLVPVTREEEVELLLAQEQILRDMDRLAEAHRLLDGALREIPDNGDLLYARGLLAAELHMLDEHEEDLRRVIELEPDNAHAYNALGYTLADQTDRYDEALKLITRALDLAPNDPFIIDSMGWVHYRLGHYDTAIEYLRRALSIRNDAEIGAHLGEVLWVAGTRDEARRVWDAALKVDPQNQTLLETLKRFAPQ